jgi:hypothetical protein
VDKNSEYGRIYSEICNGFSTDIIENSTVYFKHPTIAEHFSTYSSYDIFIKEGRKKGLQTDKEKIEEAINGKWWASEKEFRIIFLKKTIQNLFKTRDKLLYPSQKIEIEKQIKQNEAILITYTKERREIVGYTLEDYANSKLTEELLIFFTFKNKDFTERLFSSRDEYYSLTDGHVEKIKNSFETYSQVFNNDNIRKIAACGFFRNLVYLNEDAYGFWGKPTTECSKYQIDVLLYGKMYKNMVRNYAENGKPVPEEILSDSDKFVEWIDNQSREPGVKSHNKKSRAGSSNMVSSTVGATKEDLNKLGVRIEKLKGNKSLLELAEEKGGTLEKSDYFKARENS